MPRMILQRRMNNAPWQQQTGAAPRRAGFSLVEILVVLVVLVVGILAIVRLFPAGFIALRNAQNSTFADRLGQAALESLKQGQGTLPDAVYLYDETQGGFNPNVTPDDLYSYSPDGTGKNTSHRYGLLTDVDADINKQRYISNETVAVPAAHVAGNVMYPPLYALAFGPISLPTTTLPAGASALPFLIVNSTPWTQQSGDSRVDPSDPNAIANPAIARHYTNPPDILSPTEGAYLADLAANTNPTPILRPTQTLFLVDKDVGQVAVPTASYAQTFTLTVTRKYGGTTTQTITVDALGIDNANNPTGYIGNWFGTTTATGGGDPLPPTTPVLVGGVSTPNPWTAVTLTRPFRYMGILPAPGGTPLFTADPYQYCLDAGNIASAPAAQTTENMGVLAFNPIAGGQNGIAPLQAQISYQTLNWHVLHENVDVPDGGGTLKLVLDHLKRGGDVQFDGTVFAGLTTDANTPTASQYDLLMLDRDTGDIYGFRGTGGNIAGTQYTNGTPTDLTGAYYLDVVDNGDDPSDSAKTDKPHIVLNYAGGRITLPAAFAGKHFRVLYSGDADWAVAVQKAPSTYTQAANLIDLSAFNTSTPNRFYYAPSGSAFVYFPACDAGKTVELDNISCTVTDKNGVTQTRQASQLTEPISDTSAGYYIDLGPGVANVIQSRDTITKLTIGGARGVSLRAVVIWHEHNTWHTRATDTLLTRSQP